MPRWRLCYRFTGGTRLRDPMIVPTFECVRNRRKRHDAGTTVAYLERVS